MKDLDDLIAGATELSERGHTKGEIADELNVSRETASWLVARSEPAKTPQPVGDPSDIHVDWKTIGGDSRRLSDASAAMASLLADHSLADGITVGIEKAGVPLATNVARRLETDLSTYTPRKHRWEQGNIEDLAGSFSRNFAEVDGRSCAVVDDTLTSGTTMAETIDAIRDAGGTPLAGVVLVDKQGVDRIDDVPVYSLIQVIRVGEAAPSDA